MVKAHLLWGFSVASSAAIMVVSKAARSGCRPALLAIKSHSCVRTVCVCAQNLFQVCVCPGTQHVRPCCQVKVFAGRHPDHLKMLAARNWCEVCELPPNMQPGAHPRSAGALVFKLRIEAGIPSCDLMTTIDVDCLACFSIVTVACYKLR